MKKLITGGLAAFLTAASLAATTVPAGLVQIATPTPRTLQDRVGDAVSAKDYGAASDSNLASAIAAIKAGGGGALYVPSAYSFTTLPSDISTVTLKFDGPSVPVTMFGEPLGTQFIAQSATRGQDSTTHPGSSHSVQHIGNIAKGSGAIGIASADMGLTVSVLKQGASYGTAQPGELDGAYITVRNDGSNSDTAALGLDVGNYGVGSNMLMEGVNSAFSGGSITHQVDVQAGIVDTRANIQGGIAVGKSIGAGGTAFSAAQSDLSGGTGKWQHLLQFTGNGAVRFDMPITSDDVASIKLFDISANSKTLGVNANNFRILNNAGSGEILTLSDTGMLTIPGSVSSGSVSTGGITASGNISGASVTSTGALSAGSLALTSDSSWTAYTPTLTAVAGTYTSATATGAYKTIGNVVVFRVKVTVTTLGTGTFPVVSLPFPVNSGTGADSVTFAGRENAASGSMVVMIAGAGSSTGQIYTYNNGNPAANGAVIYVSGTYVK